MTAAAPPAVKAVLRGHSGAVVTLHTMGGGTSVRKMAGETRLNDRLRAQCQKQRELAARGVCTPEVLASGEIDGRFCFDMRYVPGISAAADIRTGGLFATELVPELLDCWLERMGGTIAGTIGAEVLLNKLASIVANCAANPALPSLLPDIRDIGRRLAAQAWPDLPQSECHGDLTLENMLIGADGRVHLIDFDVPDISSLWMDVGKLYQDLIGHWCIRDSGIDDPGSIAHGTALMALHRLRRAVEPVIARRIPALPAALPKLAALNLMRALPYTRDARVAAYILRQVAALEQMDA